MTAVVAVAVPPTPVQVSVNVVVTDSALLVALPLVACAPAQPPDAVHELAFVLVHESCTLAPLATLVGVTVRLTAGAGAPPVTITLTSSAVEVKTPSARRSSKTSVWLVDGEVKYGLAVFEYESVTGVPADWRQAYCKARPAGSTDPEPLR